MLFCSLLIIVLVGLTLRPSNSEFSLGDDVIKSKTYRIEAAIIVDRHSRATHYANRHQYVQKFVEDFQSQSNVFFTNDPLSIGHWPPVFTGNCPTLPGHPAIAYRAEGPGKHAEGFERGLLIAHKIIWDDFLYRSEPQSLNFTDGVLMIFEDDVFPRIPNFVERALSEVYHMNVDLKFLGWCFGDRNNLETPPYCTHAYALTLAGIRKLTSFVVPCGPSVDVQMIAVAKKKQISWAYASLESYSDAGSNDEVKNIMTRTGKKFYALGSNELVGDGIFGQRRFSE